MRINLITPFAEKDSVKALGARWDATRKNWYIENVADLTPFLRWLPKSVAVAVAAPTLNSPSNESVILTKADTAKPSEPLTKMGALQHCGCAVPPWEDCEHTLRGHGLS